ncbi:uncharacterized protein cubi_01727 [Cryptosporidium ubiquitum]|uniref:4Fe-4S ferredoxin-type domain-containing protein n=1 Tax=Cryptosporidium ubiquitum TaxID=857276 RepID=A0A1J4MDZ5_9CRYT|nr:uncharacterized protein cubi_01727 [Cryptosporidium ubiquitum]OII71252.1 hypothetical protein cubi_01727 [Cryptosporidium ubiquitum]
MTNCEQCKCSSDCKCCIKVCPEGETKKNNNGKCCCCCSCCKDECKCSPECICKKNQCHADKHSESKCCKC